MLKRVKGKQGRRGRQDGMRVRKKRDAKEGAGGVYGRIEQYQESRRP